MLKLKGVHYKYLILYNNFNKEIIGSSEQYGLRS